MFEWHPSCRRIISTSSNLTSRKSVTSVHVPAQLRPGPPTQHCHRPHRPAAKRILAQLIPAWTADQRTNSNARSRDVTSAPIRGGALAAVRMCSTSRPYGHCLDPTQMAGTCTDWQIKLRPSSPAMSALGTLLAARAAGMPPRRPNSSSLAAPARPSGSQRVHRARAWTSTASAS